MRRVWLLLILLPVLLPALLAAAGANDPLWLDWPAEQTSVSGTVTLRGTVNPPGLQSYFIEAAPFTLGSTAPARWTPITLPAPAPVVAADLGTWNTTVFADGIYQLRLHVILSSGESIFYTIAPLAVNNQGRTFSAAPVSVIATPGAVILTAVPTPTRVPPTPAPLPVAAGGAAPGRPAGARMPLGGHVGALDDRAFAAARSAGMTWIKYQVRYRSGDSIDIPRDVIGRIRNAGFRSLLGIVGDPAELAAQGEAYYAAFAAYLGQVAALGPDAIEVWNEPNLDREWPTGQIDPRRYADLLRPAYQAIKAANPAVLVITGALAPTGAEGAFGLARVWNDDRYYNVMTTTDIGQHADCIGVHYNEGIVPPEATTGDPRDNYPTRYLPAMLDRVHRALGSLNLPLCMTELGYLTAEGYPPLPGGFAWAQNVTLAQQADWLRGAARVLENYGPRPVLLMIVWNVDFTRYDTDPMAGYAILRPDGTCPACAALAAR
jgi:hypothetical protein